MPSDPRPGRLPLVRLFCTCWLIYAVHWAPFMIREEFPAITLATHGTLNVQRFVDWTPDIFRVQDGRAFINNNPGASIVGAIPLLIARPVLDAIERWNDTLPSSIERARVAPAFAASSAVQARREWYFMAVGFLTVAGLMAPISAFIVVAVAWTLLSGGIRRRQALAAALLLGFATPVFVRTEYLNHNLLVGHAGLVAALLLWSPARDALASWRAAAAGALCGFAVLCDYSGIIVLGAAGLYTCLRAGDARPDYATRARLVAIFGAGAAPLLVLLAVYQWWAFGYPALPSQHFMPAIEPTARGYRGMSWPSAELLWMNFFDSRFGLFTVCPLLAFGLAAPLIRKVTFRMPVRETALVFLFFAALTVFCASNQYSRLQYTTGIRYLVPAVPGLLFLSLQVVQAVPAAIRNVVLAVSVLIAWLPAVTQAPFMTFTWRLMEFQLSWVRRMSEYGVVLRPVSLTLAVLIFATLVVGLMWAPQILRGLRIRVPIGGP